MNKKLIAAITCATVTSIAVAVAQVVPPTVTSIGPNDMFQDVVGGNAQAGNYYASAALIGNYGASQTGNNPENTLIGGDASTNLFQRGTTGSSVTTTATYGGPDRFVYWSGASTAMTVSQDTTAADLPFGTNAAFKMARTSGQTGVVQMCMAQEVESANTYAYQGKTAEFDFDAIPGANFSGANLMAYIITGTGTDEGVSSLAFGLNAGGGGSSGWTGQASAAAVTVPVTIGLQARNTIAAAIPSNTKEMAVAVCYTPTGTAGTNDYVALSNLQLVRNSALSGSTGVALTNDTRAKAFSRRPLGLETMLQQRYYYRLNETPNGLPMVGASCEATGSATGQCTLQAPVTMRAATTFSVTAGTIKINIAGTATAAGTLTGQVGNPTGGSFTHALTNTAGQYEQIQGGGGTGFLAISSEL